MCARTIYCTNIDKKVSQADVKLFFESICGEVYRLRLLGDYHHSTRIAFVEFVMGKIINRPFAGTVRRGKTEKEDEMQEQQLLSDEKQCAEHIMLVDLGRNDVGKVSKPGSVKVKLMNIERYSHVMHISSMVSGELDDNNQSWDALRAALPVGTVSGAPKIILSLSEELLKLVPLDLI